MNIPSTKVVVFCALLLTGLIVACVEIPASVTSAPALVTTGSVETPAPASADLSSSELLPETATQAQPQSVVIAPAVADTESAVIAEQASVAAVAGELQSDTASSEIKLPVKSVSAENAGQNQALVETLCQQLGNKLSSVSVTDCLQQNFAYGGALSINKRPMVIKEYSPGTPAAQDFRVLIMGGIHGDEYSSISILFKWLALFSPQALEGEFHWLFAPLVNPDGLLDGHQAKRQNANGVDLNRNFPSSDWNDTAASYWQQSTGSNPRRFPGTAAASEPEVQWIVSQIEEFRPDVIVSVHAPYHLLDFDGPAVAPDKIGELYLHQLGVYPGSLGNFAGLNRSIPVVTLELPSAGIMPPADQIGSMWKDLVVWLDREGRKGLSEN